METLFEVAAGSVRGRDHVRTGKNNQDALAWSFRGGAVVAVVCDGCGTSERSEVGAQIGVRLFIEACRAELGGLDARSETAWEGVRERMLLALQRFVNLLGGDAREVVRDFFLFTVLGAVVTPRTTWVAAAGDGVTFVNGERLPLGPFPGNAPPYLAYGLVEEWKAASRFQALQCIPTAELQNLFLGTDGTEDLLNAVHRGLPGKAEPLGPVEQFWEDDRFFRNPDRARRKLALASREVVQVSPAGRLARESGLLSDDTTLIALRRRRAR